jgi:hypothetical protein
VDTFNAQGSEVRDIGYLASFLSVRQLTRIFEGSNPTWVKVAATPSDRIQADDAEVDRTVKSYYDAIRDRIHEMPLGQTPSLLVRANAAALPLQENSISTVLTSPPYLTRIDYAVAYRRELAVLGFDTALSRGIRASLMGTTVIRPASEDAIGGLGELTRGLLRQISQHSSKASSGYYLKQAQQYFTDLAAALREISRVCKPGATMTLVVQDSFYKEIHLSLADICIAESEVCGWTLEKHDRFPVKRTLTSLNTAAKKYDKKTVTESAIVLRKVSP